MNKFENREKLYNNPDSFSDQFDKVWRNLNNSSDDLEQKLAKTLKLLENHPFYKEYPDTAKEIANFRIRLLDL